MGCTSSQPTVSSEQQQPPNGHGHGAPGLNRHTSRSSASGSFASASSPPQTPFKITIQPPTPQSELAHGIQPIRRLNSVESDLVLRPISPEDRMITEETTPDAAAATSSSDQAATIPPIAINAASASSTSAATAPLPAAAAAISSTTPPVNATGGTVSPPSTITSDPSTLQLMTQLHQLTQTNMQLLDKVHASEAKNEFLKAENLTLVNELQIRRQKDAESEHRRDATARTIPLDGPIHFRTLEKEVAHSNELLLALNDHKARLKEAELKIQEQASDHTALIGRFGESQALFFSLQKEHHALTEKYQTTSAKLTACEETLATSQKENEVSIGFVSELRAHLQTLEARHVIENKEARQELQNLQQSFLKKQSELHTAQLELQTKGEQIEELKELVQQLQSAQRSFNSNQDKHTQSLPSEPSTARQFNSSDLFLSATPALEDTNDLSKPSSSVASASATTTHPSSNPTDPKTSTDSFTTVHTQHSQTGSLDGDAEFAQWLAAKRAEEQAQSAVEPQEQETSGPPMSQANFPFLPSPFTSQDPVVMATAMPLEQLATPLRVQQSLAFPTPESEAEFQQWLQEQKRKEEDEAKAAATSVSQSQSQATAKPPSTSEPVRPTTSQIKEGEAEFRTWLASRPKSMHQTSTDQKQQYEAVFGGLGPETEPSTPIKPPAATSTSTSLQPLQTTSTPPTATTPRGHQPASSWPHFTPANDLSPLPLNQQQSQPHRRAWNESNAAEVNEQISNANTNSSKQPPVRTLLQHSTASQSTATLPSWAESKQQPSDSDPATHLGPVHAKYATSSKSPTNGIGAAISPSNASSGPKTVLSPSSKFSYTNWQSNNASSQAIALPAAIISPFALELTPSPLSFLSAPPVLWLRADSFLTEAGQTALMEKLDTNGSILRRITGWFDSSPSGNHAAVCSPSNRSLFHEAHPALNDCPVVELGGGTSFKLTQPIKLTHFTLFLVVKVVGAFQFLLGGKHGTHLPCFTSGAIPQLVTRKSTVNISEAKSSVSSFACATFIRHYSKVRAYLHGHDVTVSGGLSGSDTTEITIEYLGQIVDENGPELVSPATIAEIILFDSAFVDADRLKVEQYLNSKYRWRKTG